MQNNESACTPFAPFTRLVKEITGDQPAGVGMRWQRDAIVALQLATEDFIVMVFEMTYILIVGVC